MNAQSALPTSPPTARLRAGALLALLAGLAPAGCVLTTGTVYPHETVTAEVIEPVAAPSPMLEIETTLSPHGAWVLSERCGRVWRPHVAVVGADFVPYTSGGDWVYTDYGWSFEADWDWGWAVFHYGRWCPDPHEGWVWVPGTTWAPAWVEWRTGGGLIGWAPLLPVGIVLVEAQWTFVESVHFHDEHPGHHPGHYRLPPERVHDAFQHSQPVNDVVVHGSARWSRGPSPREVERDAGAEVKPVHIQPPPPGAVRRTTVRLPAAKPTLPMKRPTVNLPTPARRTEPAKPAKKPQLPLLLPDPGKLPRRAPSPR